MSTGKIAGGLLAILVAGVVLWLTQLDGLEWLKHKFPGLNIEVRSATSPAATEFLADEKLSIVLTNVKTPKVFWVFDDTTVVSGSVAAEYAFPFDPTVLSSDAKDRRIDAFARVGDSYATTSNYVRVRNTKSSATAQLEAAGLVVSAPAYLGKEWTLTGAEVAQFHDGLFTKKLSLVGSPAQQGETVSFTADAKQLSWALSYSPDRSLRTNLRRRAMPGLPTAS